MLRMRLTAWVVGLAAAVAAGAAPSAACELQALPSSVQLDGPGAALRVLVLETMHGRATGDLVGQAAFTGHDPRVVRIAADGTFTAVGDGETTVTVEVGPRSVKVPVRVRGATVPHPISFRNEVQAVLTRNACNSGACHGALAGKGGFKLSLRGYDLAADHFALTRQAAGRRVDTLRPEKSLLVAKPVGEIKHGGGMKITPDTRDWKLLVDWIAQGAPPAKADDARLTGIELLPATSVLKPGDKLRMLVLARYADGTTTDVTAWTKFSSTEDLVAGADQNGRVTVTGRGEAAIVAVFDSMPAIARITSPHPAPADPTVFAKAARSSDPAAAKIDELVIAKLAELNIPPAPLCTDAEFVRRVHLDLIGTLPSPQETRAFLADPDPGKRDKLVDSLLRRPEFTDFWTYKWSDLLLVSSRLPNPAMWSFHDWIRRSVADNKPWDAFARDILTAQGSTLDNGAGNYFVLHKDITRLTEATSVTFLGVSLTCARCHNHPLEKWTQDQYYGLANLLSRVRLKNGKRAGELLLHAADTGDAAHPRTGRPMPPQPLDGPALDIGSPADRRAALADWLVKPENPFFARAAVNRIWKHVMGRGLVENDDDLRLTNPPSNAALLDHLAAEFARGGYDVRAAIRTFVRTAAYQRSSTPPAGSPPDDRFHSRYLVRRLPAEVLLDAYSSVSGTPTDFKQQNRERRAVGYAYPKGTRAIQLPDTRTFSQFLDAFGRPERDQACSCERNDETTMGQALHLANGPTFNEKLRAAGARPGEWVNRGVTLDAAIEEAVLLTLCRLPTDGERTRLRVLLAAGLPPDAPDGPMPAGMPADRRKVIEEARRTVFEDLLWSLGTGKEFLFNH